MADISIGNTIIKNPLNLLHDVRKLEAYDRTIDGSMIVNMNVNSENQSIDKYRWEIPGLIDSEMFLIKEEAKKKGNLPLIDYHKIIEVLSGDGSIKTWTLQRLLSGETPLPAVEVNDSGLDVQVTPDVDPIDGEVHINKDTGVMTFYTAPTKVANNIVVKYEPKYEVHIMSYQHTFFFDTVANYVLVCEEV
ncbi:hypothetical protein ES705_42017 [subsurface metagenome]